jgi:hypothetical protein
VNAIVVPKRAVEIGIRGAAAANARATLTLEVEVAMWRAMARGIEIVIGETSNDKKKKKRIPRKLDGRGIGKARIEAGVGGTRNPPPLLAATSLREAGGSGADLTPRTRHHRQVVVAVAAIVVVAPTVAAAVAAHHHLRPTDAIARSPTNHPRSRHGNIMIKSLPPLERRNTKIMHLPHLVHTNSSNNNSSNRKK